MFWKNYKNEEIGQCFVKSLLIGMVLLFIEHQICVQYSAFLLSLQARPYDQSALPVKGRQEVMTFLSPKQYKPLCSSAVGSFPLLHKQEKGYSLNLDPGKGQKRSLRSWNQTAPKCEIQTTKNFIIISPEIWELYTFKVLWS